MYKHEVSYLYPAIMRPDVENKNKSVGIKTPSVIIRPRYTTIEDINDYYKSLNNGKGVI